MRNQRFTQVVAILLAVVCIGSASYFLRPIDAKREAMGLSASRRDVESMPPEIALPTIALAGFRGLAVDYFWLRAEQLKQEGRYYEANQLASWICKLQPRFPKVWAFQAWNLAWNISVGTRTPQERWNWVYNGVKLLRDEGLVYNPKALSLYRELAWIFFFKMGDYMDDQHWNYKRRWAWDMQRVMGEPPPDIQAESSKLELAAILESWPQTDKTFSFETNKTKQDLADIADPSTVRVVEWFRQIAQAPATWNELVADTDMAALVNRCLKAGVELQTGSLTGSADVNGNFFDKYQRVLTPTYKQQFVRLRNQANYTPDEQMLLDILSDPATKPLAERLINSMRCQVLRIKYKLDATWMLSLMERFGPIDWRVPDAHGMYWTSFGIKQMDDLNVKNVNEFFGPNTTLNTDRIMVFALQRLTTYSRLFFVPNLEQIDLSLLNLLPDLRFVAATHKAYLEVGQKYDPEAGNIAGSDLRDGHQNYLRDAIRLFYLYGQYGQANYYYEYLRVNYKLVTGETNPDYMLTMREFVMHEEFTDRLSDPRIVTDAITGLINQSLRFLVMGDTDKVNGLLRFAKEDIYGSYVLRWKDNPADRMKLPSFETIFNDAAASNLNTPGIGEDMLGTKSRMWKALPLTTQLAVYDGVAPTLKEQCEAVGVTDNMDQIFPPPPGMEEYRKTHMQAKPKEQKPSDYSVDEMTRKAQEGRDERHRDRIQREGQATPSPQLPAR